MSSQEPRVLIVESNDALRAMLFTVLRYQPISVDTAATADDALRKVRACDYALVMVDLDMEHEAGLRFVEAFREERPEAPTFVLAVRNPRDSETYLDAELISAVLTKPLEIDTLAEVVRECALVVPPPAEPLPCPPSESEIRTRMQRGPYVAN